MKTKMEITLSTYTTPYPFEQSSLIFLLPVFFVGIDTSLQFVFSKIEIMDYVTLNAFK